MSPSARHRRRQLGGFTLIEVLVALLILGIMSALGYGTYRTARRSAEHTEESLKRSREIEFGMRMLVQDFAEMVPRPVRDPLGQTALPSLPALRGTSGFGTVSTPNLGALSNPEANSSAASSMSFNSSPGFGSTSTTAASLVDLTRAGWSNTAGQQRSTLQRVSYSLLDDVLKRSYTTSLDTVTGTTPIVQDVFAGVKAIQFRYLDDNQAWHSSWPQQTAVSAATTNFLTTRPIAVEVVIEFKDWGRIRRLIEVAG